MKPPPVVLSEDEIALVRGMVIEQDDSLLALNKPSGLSSQGGRIKAHTLDELLYAFVKPSGAKPQLVHRLDRDTSGVILAARSQPAASFFGKAMIAQKFSKTYLALIAAPPEPRGGVIEAPLRREEIGREAYMRVCPADHPDAQTASTRYRTLAVGPGAALIECSPKTGRMHQIRVHLASLGLPIIGDARYGGSLMVGGRPAARLMLHAAALTFPHPEGGRRRIEASPPEDFVQTALLGGLERNAIGLPAISTG